MDFFQVVIYGAILLLLFNYVRKFLAARKVNHYSPAEARKRLNDRSAMFLDVRTDYERKAGAIKNSINIPLNQLSGRIDELKKYQNKEFICYCRSGNRSVSAAVILSRNGFNASNLRGGISRWNFSEN